MMKQTQSIQMFKDEEVHYVGEVNGVSFLKFDRKQLQQQKDFLVERSGVYFLLNSINLEMYIGESQDLYSRLVTHDKQKDFWNYAVCFNNPDFTKTACTYIERNMIARAKEVGFNVQNANGGFNQNITFFEQKRCDLNVESICEIINLLHTKQNEF